MSQSPESNALNSLSHEMDAYEQGAARLRRSVTDLSPAEQKAVPIPGKWSAHQVVIHLQDAETSFADRIRRIIAQDNPTVMAWNENDFAARLFYDRQSMEDALLQIETTRRQAARILRSVSAADMDRAGMHSGTGRITAREVLAKANWHLDHHLKFIHEKRAALNKPAV